MASVLHFLVVRLFHMLKPTRIAFEGLLTVRTFVTVSYRMRQVEVIISCQSTLENLRTPTAFVVFERVFVSEEVRF